MVYWRRPAIIVDVKLALDELSIEKMVCRRHFIKVQVCCAGLPVQVQICSTESGVLESKTTCIRRRFLPTEESNLCVLL